MTAQKDFRVSPLCFLYIMKTGKRLEVRILWKKLAIIVILIIFIDPIYTAGKAVVQQVITWANNDEIETVLLSTKDKIIDVTAKLSENTSIETATPIEEKPEGGAVTAPVAKNLKQS